MLNFYKNTYYFEYMMHAEINVETYLQWLCISYLYN